MRQSRNHSEPQPDSTSLDQELARFQQFLEARSLKLTTERKALVRAIFARHYHFEADELLFNLRGNGIKISRATIYRTLELLVKCNMVRRVHLGEEHYHYESVRQNSHHDHLICTACGDVVEFDNPQLIALQREICRSNRFTPTSHDLQILGVCSACAERGEQPDLPDRVRMVQLSGGLRK